MKKNLVLTGMMGVGKSTIGKSPAYKTFIYAFIDVDRLIEKKEGKKINVIFRNKGESFFRKLENDISLDNLQNQIICYCFRWRCIFKINQFEELLKILL